MNQINFLLFIRQLILGIASIEPEISEFVELTSSIDSDTSENQARVRPQETVL